MYLTVSPEPLTKDKVSSLLDLTLVALLVGVVALFRILVVVLVPLCVVANNLIDINASKFQRIDVVLVTGIDNLLDSVFEVLALIDGTGCCFPLSADSSRTNFNNLI